MLQTLGEVLENIVKDWDEPIDECQPLEKEVVPSLEVDGESQPASKQHEQAENSRTVQPEEATRKARKGHIRISNDLYEALSTYLFTAKERRVIDLIIRLSLGCQRDIAIIHPMNRFVAASVSESDVRGILEGLVIKRVVFANMRKGHYMLNQSHVEWLMNAPSLEKYGKLIGRNLNEDEPDKQWLLKVSKALIHCLIKLPSSSSPKVSKTRKANLVKHYEGTKRITKPLLSESLSSTPPKPADSAKPQPPKNNPKDNKEKQPKVVVGVPPSEEELDRLTALFQSNTSAPDKGDRDFIAGLVNKHDVDYVTEKLELLQDARNVNNPNGWLIKACKEDYPPSAKMVEARREEAQRKANEAKLKAYTEAQDKKREQEEARNDEIRAEEAMMEKIKEAMSQTERNELQQRAKYEIIEKGISKELLLAPIIEAHESMIIKRRNAILDCIMRQGMESFNP